MFVEVVRLFMVVLGTTAGFWVARDVTGDAGSNLEGLGGVLGCLAGYVGGGVVGRLVERAMGAVEREAERIAPARLVAAALGAGLGGLVGALVAVPFVVLLPLRIGLVVGGLLVWVFGFAGGRVLGTRSVAVLEMLGLSTRPLVRAQAFAASDGLLSDTSVLMDGQLLTLARAGLVGGDLLVPRFVLDELQGFADARETAQARRARRGLEALDVLRREGLLRVYVLDDEVPEFADVDAKLVALARRLQLRLLTNDGALARVAEVQGVPTSNLRRLGVELAPSMVPGDVVRVALTRPGREAGQGVGHLDDGSMVVVNDGEELVGQGEAAFEVTSVVPTSMGRIVFARPEEPARV
jgi:uncharacterized protein YacL